MPLAASNPEKILQVALRATCKIFSGFLSQRKALYCALQDI